MQLEQLHKNLKLLKGEKKADTLIKRAFPLFRLGTADWNFASTQQNRMPNEERLNLGLGAFVAGGEANVILNINSNMPLSKQTQYYRWRYVNNNNALVKQVTLGKVFTMATSSIFAPVTGVSFTNSPTTYRRSYGSYTLSNTTEPGWTVELYVNNVLVDFAKADASGFYTFEVPMVYGSSAIKLRFYGPWGEERTDEQYINVPFNFVPLHTFEYTVTGGMVNDVDKSRYSKANFSYGVSNHLTMAGGVEYMSSVSRGKVMPYLNASMRFHSNVLFTAEHMLGVRTKSTFNYRLPGNFQFDLAYLRYNRNQTAVRFVNLEEKKAVLSMPIHTKKFNAFSRLIVNRVTYPIGKNTAPAKFTSAELLFSGMIHGISTNLTATALRVDGQKAVVMSNFSAAFKFLSNYRFTPQLQYDFSKQKFVTIKAELERNIASKGFLNFAVEKYPLINDFAYSVGVRYNLSFTQTAFSVRKSKNGTITSQSARGSLLYDDYSHQLSAANQSYTGRASLTIAPFLDINCNGIRDSSEPRAYGLNVKVSGGTVQKRAKNSTLKVYGLEAYNEYLLELDKNSFDNISWQIKKPLISIVSEPNQFKLLEVPIAVVAEASGYVNITQADGTRGIGRIIIKIFDQNMKLIAKTLSKSDGYFTYLGLAPGNYIAQVDADQVQNLNMTASAPVSFTVKPNRDGDIVDNLKFSLTK